MLKKLVCLALAMLMVLPMLVACSKDDDKIGDIANAASRYTNTLNVWVVTEEGTDPEQAKAVNNAISKITEAKFKTRLNIKFFTEKEYYAAVEKAFADHDAAIKNGIKPEANKSDETFLNEYGIPELKYPTAPDYQVDILYIGNHEKYVSYINQGWLAPLDVQLSESALKLSYYVNKSILDAARYNNMLYGVPNNHRVGEYVYLLADKNLMAEYGDVSGSSVYDSGFQAYLDYVFAKYTGTDKVYPIYSATGKVDINFTHYWSFDPDTTGGYSALDPDKFSIFGDNFTGKNKLDNLNLLKDDAYMKRLAAKKHYENTEGFLTTDANAKSAVRIVKGGFELKEQYEKEGYEVLVMQPPMITEDEIFSSLFAVGAHTADKGRAAEILTYFNTNAELRNLFQYGIENVNYTLETTEIDKKEYVYAVPTDTNKYHMDLAKTGNEFIAYPNSKDTVLEVAYAKEQNLNIVRYPTVGVALDFKKVQMDSTSVAIMNAVSAKVGAYLDTLATPAEVLSVCAQAKANRTSRAMAQYLLSITGPVSYTEKDGTVVEITEASLMNAVAVMSKTEPATDEKVQSPYQMYLQWCLMNGIKNPGEGVVPKP